MSFENKKVLAVGAHPDDVEIMCAGTLFLLRDAGYQMHIGTMSLGDCGSMEKPAQEIRRTRRKEAENACQKLGATYSYLGMYDFAIFNNDLANRRTVALVRDVDPLVVFTHPQHDYLSDHETTSLLVRNACFYAPAPNYDTLNLTASVRSAAIPWLYYCHPLEGIDIYGKNVTPEFYVDVTASFDRKLEMLSSHESQRSWLRAHHGIDEYLESVRRWCGELGKRATAICRREVKFAEAFRQHRGHSYPEDNLILRILNDKVVVEPDY